MRRNKTFKRGRLIPVLLAGAVGYLIGGWHSEKSDTSKSDSSVARSIALRFPQEWNMASAVSGAAGVSTAATAMATPRATEDAQLALFDPEPMVPRGNRQASAQSGPNDGAAAAMQTVAVTEVGPSPAPDGGKPIQAPPAAAAKLPPAIKVAVRRAVTNRPDYTLDDAQIASIKARLNLTPDQARMWPAVEAALRNMAYARMQAAQGRGAPAAGAQLAAVDPDAVEDLKSAAAPLLMSFTDEQKRQARDLAHIMGLDQFTSQF